MEHEAFFISIPANVYNGREYDFRSTVIRLNKNPEDTEQDAIDWVNSHKSIVLDMLSEKFTYVGRDLKKRWTVMRPVKKNVFFRDRYHVQVSKVTTIEREP
jgi:hypothetical protein